MESSNIDRILYLLLIFSKGLFWVVGEMGNLSCLLILLWLFLMLKFSKVWGPDSFTLEEKIGNWESLGLPETAA